MRDFSFEHRRQAAKRWCIQDVKRQCDSVKHFVTMDCEVQCGNGGEGGGAPFVADASFLDWVVPGHVFTAGSEGGEEVLLPDPFEARGARYRMVDSCEGGVANMDGGGPAGGGAAAGAAKTERGGMTGGNAGEIAEGGAEGEFDDCFTILFTSGSSGTPKAVAIGVNAFVQDIAGGSLSEAKGSSESVTVSGWMRSSV
jgi:hypothetical protein